jgi:hypothetical protein
MSQWTSPVREIEYQLSSFRRGELSRVIAATDVTGDSLLAYRWLLAGVSLASDFNEPRIRQERLVRNIARFDVITSPDTALVSIEVIDSSGVSGRVRLASGPPAMPAQRFTSSDMLLTMAVDPLPGTLEEAAARGLGSTSVYVGAIVGVFWEMYGVSPADTVSVSIAVSPRRPGLLGRLAEALNMRDRTDSLIVRWQDARSTGLPEEPRAVNLDVSRLRSGDYTLHMTLSVAGQEPVSVRKALEIRAPERLQ